MATTFLVPKNNAASTLSGSITSGATVIPVNDIAQFPATFPFHVTIGTEIIKVTGVSGSNLDPCTRAQEGTTATAHSAGDVVELRITAKAISDLNTAVNALEAAGGGGLTLTEVEIDLGTLAAESGKFTIAGSGLTADKAVLITQGNGPYTGKGTLTDEAEMDVLNVTGKVTSATTIECFWNSVQGPVRGNFKFEYQVSA